MLHYWTKARSIFLILQLVLACCRYSILKITLRSKKAAEKIDLHYFSLWDILQASNNGFGWRSVIILYWPAKPQLMQNGFHYLIKAIYDISKNAFKVQWHKLWRKKEKYINMNTSEPLLRQQAKFTLFPRLDGGALKACKPAPVRLTLTSRMIRFPVLDEGRKLARAYDITCSSLHQHLTPPRNDLHQQN